MISKLPLAKASWQEIAVFKKIQFHLNFVFLERVRSSATGCHASPGKAPMPGLSLQSHRRELGELVVRGKGDLFRYQNK